MIVLFIVLFHSIIFKERQSPRGLGVGRGGYLLKNVLPWHHTEEFTLRDLDGERQGSNEKIVLNPVSNYESDGAPPIVLLPNQEGIRF